MYLGELYGEPAYVPCHYDARYSPGTAVYLSDDECATIEARGGGRGEGREATVTSSSDHTGPPLCTHGSPFVTTPFHNLPGLCFSMRE